LLYIFDRTKRIFYYWTSTDQALNAIHPEIKLYDCMLYLHVGLRTCVLQHYKPVSKSSILQVSKS